VETQCLLSAMRSAAVVGIKVTCCFVWGLGSSVGIVTGYGLDGSGIESRWEARFFAPVQTGLGAHPASCTMGTWSFQGVKSGRGVTLTPHNLLVPWSWKSRAIPVPPYGPYGLYRASVPVQGWPLPFFYFFFYHFANHNSSVSITTRLRAGRFRVPIPVASPLYRPSCSEDMATLTL